MPLSASNGRFVLGIGLSHRPVVENFYKMEWRKPVRHMLDYLDILLHDADFSQRLFERVDQGRPSARQLILEITEDTHEADLRAATPALRELKARGVRIALDDFGSGLSSFTYLKTLPVDYLKIDGGFVRDILKDSVSESMVAPTLAADPFTAWAVR